jgi:hypothetical protein
MDPVGRTGALMLTIAEGLRLNRARGILEPLPRSPISLGDYRGHMLGRLTEFSVTVEWRDPEKMPAGAAAYALTRRNHIVCPPMDSEEDVAVVAHELGHCAAEAHRGPLHCADPKVTRWLHCCRCEVLAWANAIVLMRPLPWTENMHRRLMRALDCHRQTPAHAETRALIDRLTTMTRFEELKLEEQKLGIQTTIVSVADAERWSRERIGR